jgi:hypothetical protein
MWYSRGKNISRHILHQHWYTCPIALPVRRNSLHRNLLTVVSASSAPPFHHRLLPNVLYATNTSPVNRKKLFMNILCIESFCPQKVRKRTLIFGSTLHKHGRHVDCWNKPLNMRMRVCYLDCHEAGLCYYLVMHIGNLLHPLQLFYFHLWTIYWLSLVALYLRRRLIRSPCSQPCDVIEQEASLLRQVAGSRRMRALLTCRNGSQGWSRRQVRP